jgi:hypothetical protein
VNNNPLNYTDPSGHKLCNYEKGQSCVTENTFQKTELNHKKHTVESKYSINISGSWDQDELDQLDNALLKAGDSAGGFNNIINLIFGGNNDDDNQELTFINALGPQARNMCGGGKSANACWLEKSNSIVIGDEVFTPAYQNKMRRPKEIGLYANLPLGIQTTINHEIGHAVESGIPFLLISYNLSVDNNKAFGGSSRESFANAFAFYIVSDNASYPGYQDQFNFISKLLK